MHEQEHRMQSRFDSERRSIAAEFETLRDARTLASTHNWLAMLATGKYICLVCTSHFHLVKTRGNWRATMPFLECNGGYEPRDGQYTRSVARHEACDVHIQCDQLEGERQSNPLKHAIAVQQAAADEITARIFVLRFTSSCATAPLSTTRISCCCRTTTARVLATGSTAV
mmetsp:Transcript_36492/g.85677  ORF Transcript_36492/g.85677 Transcript_36492/m.85677 type:complete len:170 (+) Transcript_36492:191-700(+)